MSCPLILIFIIICQCSLLAILHAQILSWKNVTYMYEIIWFCFGTMASSVHYKLLFDFMYYALHVHSFYNGTVWNTSLIQIELIFCDSTIIMGNNEWCYIGKQTIIIMFDSQQLHCILLISSQYDSNIVLYHVNMKCFVCTLALLYMCACDW